MFEKEKTKSGTKDGIIKKVVDHDSKPSTLPPPSKDVSEKLTPPKPPSATLSPMEEKLLKDIRQHLSSVRNARYVTAIPLPQWLATHKYPSDFIEAASKL